MESLEQKIEQSVKTREIIAKALVRTFEVEKDFADIIALDAVEQAIGKDRLEEYKLTKRAKERWDKFKQWSIVALKGGGMATVGSLVLYVVFVVVVWVGGGMYACATRPDYPRTYEPLPEQARFLNREGSDWRGTHVVGLNDDNQLCVRGHGTLGKEGTGSSKTCIHPAKADKLNQAMQQAVDEDINGVIWNEPNGRGEVWTVERNNYRFVITANQDENFK